MAVVFFSFFFIIIIIITSFSTAVQVYCGDRMYLSLLYNQVSSTFARTACSSVENKNLHLQFAACTQKIVRFVGFGGV